MNSCLFCAVGSILSAAAPLAAQLHESDIILQIDQGRIVTGALTPGGGTQALMQNVFETSLGDFDFTNDPGFDSMPGTFAPSTQVGFDILGPLLRWDGDFDQPSLEQMRIRFGTLERVTPTDEQVIAGFGVSPSQTGQFHRHLGFTLLPPATDGVYLLTLRLWSTQAGVAPSEPLYIVFGQRADPQVLAQAAQSLLPLRCAADLGGQGGLPAPDGQLDNNDFVVFIDRFFAADAAADLGAQGGVPGTDGFFDSNDFIVFIDLFFAGCG